MLRSPILLAVLAPAAVVLATSQWAPSASSADVSTLLAASAPDRALATREVSTAEIIRLVVAPTGNEARYRIQERLAGMDLPYDAVGVTNGIAGEILIGANGQVVADQSLITVDVTKLKSDKDRRDTFVQRRLLETAEHPTVDLVPTALRGLPNPIPTTGSKTFLMVGNLTVKGVTRPTTWRVTANFQGKKVTGKAATSFTFAQFGLTQPRVPVVLSLADTIKLEYDFNMVREVVGGATVH